MQSTELELSERPAGDTNLWRKQSCCVCGSDLAEAVYPSNVAPDLEIRKVFWGHYEKGKERKFHTGIQKCQKCGHIYSSPYLTPEALTDVYSRSEFDNTWNVSTEMIARTIHRYLSAATKWTPSKDLVVDVGCDVGILLEVARGMGFARAFGIEPNRGAAAQAQEKFRGDNRVEIQHGNYRRGLVKPGRASLVSFVHVLDHIVQPQEVLAYAYEDLAPGGVVIAVTHNIRSLLARMTGRHFPPINLQHPQFFSPRSLKRLFESAGFEVVGSISTLNDYPLSHYIRYAPLLPNAVKSAISTAISKVYARPIPVSIPLGNILTIGRKKGGTV